MRSILFAVLLAACGGEVPAAVDSGKRDAGFSLEDSGGIRLDSGATIDAEADAGEDAATSEDASTPDSGAIEVQRGGVIVSEFSALGTEWIELYNPGAASLELEAATLVTGSGAFPIAAGSLGAGEYVLHPSDAVLGDQGDFIEVRIGGVLEDRVDYRGFPLVADRSTQLSSAALSSDANDDAESWCVPIFTQPTPGAANGSCHALAISEFTYENGKEFIELAGPGGASLVGIELQLDNDLVPLVGNLTLEGFYGISVSDLPDDSGRLALLEAGRVIDAVAWGSATGEGTPLPDLGGASLYPSNYARRDLTQETNDNRTDFRHDPSPTIGTLNDAPAPSILRIDPDDALAGLAATVRIEGTDFTDGMTVMVAGETASCSSVAVNAVSCALSGGAAGPGDVRVVLRPETGGSDATLATAFTWTAAVNETDLPNEADFCILQWPPATSGVAGAPTELIYARIYEAGLTDVTAGQAPGIIAELGYGPAGSDPSASNAWVWAPAQFNAEYGNDDEYMAPLLIPAAGSYAYTYRFSLDGGLTWTFADNDGAGFNPNQSFDLPMVATVTIN
jgi:hypothetical protein